MSDASYPPFHLLVPVGNVVSRLWHPSMVIYPARPSNWVGLPLIFSIVDFLQIFDRLTYCCRMFPWNFVSTDETSMTCHLLAICMFLIIMSFWTERSLAFADPISPICMSRVLEIPTLICVDRLIVKLLNIIFPFWLVTYISLRILTCCTWKNRWINLLDKAKGLMFRH